MLHMRISALAKKIFSYKFLVSIIVWYNILWEINITSKQLQRKDIHIYDAITQLEHTQKFLTDYRCSSEFDKILVDARNLAEEIDLPAFFETLRFEQTHQISLLYGFLYDIHALWNRNSDQVMEHCLNLQVALQNGLFKDIDANEMCTELQAIARRVSKNSSPHDVLQYICENKFTSSFPNTCIALRILLTLLISVASGERIFSKLKLIKTYVRSSMTQERLVGLSTISIEHDIAENIDLKNLVNEFARRKARRVPFDIN